MTNLHTYTVLVHNIEWDTDGQTVDGLPSEIHLQLDFSQRPDDDDPKLIEQVDAWLSENHDWCVSVYHVDVL